MGTIKQLRWWAYKILPLAYDDSLSYYEVLSKATQKLNEVIDTTNKLPEAISEEIKNQLSGNDDSVFDNLFSGLINAVASKEADEITFTPSDKQGGEIIWLGNTLYEVITPMAAGTNYIIGTNIVPVDIDGELKKIKEYICTHNEYFHERATQNHESQTYLYWKDKLYRVDADIHINDIISERSTVNGTTTGQLTLVNAMDEITNHYIEMHKSDNNLQTQIDGNEGDIEELRIALATYTANNANPQFVDNLSDMSNHNQIYVLKSNGHIYYWNGNNFSDSGLNYALNNNTYIYNGSVATDGTQKLANYVLPGSYSFPEINVSDSPIGGNLTLVNTIGINNFVKQSLFSTANFAKPYYRILDNNGNVINDWTQPFSNYTETPNSYIYRGSIATDGTQPLSHYTEIGTYSFPNSKFSDESELPVTGNLTLVNEKGINNFIKQTLYAPVNFTKPYYRFLNASGEVVSNWTQPFSNYTETNNSYIYHGSVATDGSQPLSHYNEIGSYSFPSSKFSDGSELPVTGNLTLVNEKGINNFIKQTLYNTANFAKPYYRYLNASGTPISEWTQPFNNYTETTNSYIYRGSIATDGSQSFTSYTGIGSYSFPQSNLTDSPYGEKVNLTLINIKGINLYTIQIVYDTKSYANPYYRLLSADNKVVNDWQKQSSLIMSEYNSPLSNKKWIACGDSFTHGDFSGLEVTPTLNTGRYAGELPVYPYVIGNATGCNVINAGVNGECIATGGTSTSFINHYQETITEDADYVTIYFGINDSHQNIPIGTIDDTETTTEYGAYNTVLKWLAENRPNTKVGIIATNGVGYEYAECAIKVAEKWGVPCLDMNGTDHILVIRNSNPNISDTAKQIANTKYRVTTTNQHPNVLCHKMESDFIRAFLERM